MSLYKKINSAIRKGNTRGAKKLLLIQLPLDDKAKYESTLQEEYDILYPTERDFTVEERVEFDLLEENIAELANDEEYLYPKFTIDYSEDSNYVTFEEYKNETRVVVEAIEAEADEEGNVTTEAVEEVKEFVRPFVPKDSYDDSVIAYLASNDAYKELESKQAKLALENLVIPSHGVNFNADITSIGYMNAVSTLAIYGILKELSKASDVTNAIVNTVMSTKIPWKNADNEVSSIRVDTVLDALQETIDTIGEVKTGETV